MAATFDSFGVSLDLTVEGAQGIERSLNTLISRGKSTGATFDQITQAVKSFVNELGAVQRIGGRWNERPDWARKAEEMIKKALGGSKPSDKNSNGKQPYERFNTPHYVIERLFRNTNLGRAYTAFQGLNLAFAQVKSVWKYGEAIASVNQRLLQLSFSSGIGISSLKATGAAAEAVGGSAQSIAQAEERLQNQLAAAKRGQGFGFLQEAFWKYGFNINLGWSAEELRMNAIRHMRTLDPKDQPSFAALVDPANKKMMMTLARASEDIFQQWVQAQSRMKNLMAESKTIEGKDRAQEAADEALKFQIAMVELTNAWNSVKDQVSNTLLPVMTYLVKSLTKILTPLAKMPGLISGITLLIAGLASVFSIFKAFKLFGWFLKNVKLPWFDGGGAASAAPVSGSAKVGQSLLKSLQWMGRMVARTLLQSLRFLRLFLRGLLASPIGIIVAAATAVYAIVKGTCDRVEEEAKKLNQKNDRMVTSGMQSRDKALHTQARRLARGELWEGDVNFLLGIGTESENRNLKGIKSITDFAKLVRQWQKSSAAKIGMAEELIGTISDDVMRMQYERIMRETGRGGTTNNDNSKNQFNQYIQIDGAKDPKAVGEAVVDAGKSLASVGTNILTTSGK